MQLISVSVSNVSANSLSAYKKKHLATSGDSKGGLGWAMAHPDCCLAPVCPPSVF